MTTLKAIGYDGNEFVSFEKQMPDASGRDLLIEIKAISINPIDSKVKHMVGGSPEKPLILGFDACGVVKSIGEEVSLFKLGDEVYYAGDMARDGSNANIQLIDERIVGHKPSSLSFAEAAAMPLTTVTAWESLFDRLGINEDDAGKSILLIGAAGGVGSIAMQLAKQVAKLKVIATASRAESKDWCLKMGADVVLEHHNLLSQLTQKNVKAPDFILCMGVPDDYMEEMISVIKPQGSICLLANAREAFDINQLKAKSIKLVWEMMFTRSKFETEDMSEQGKILNTLSGLIDNNKINCTVTRQLSSINVANITRAHNVIEAGAMIGKLTISNE
ncbi:MAG: zinc-binding alcohol dehydrogenase family protein [Gammaproteobacteria bacterium]|nr:zinc-binding alcohol dehydrogenase family protein [Gammaproteobacteria bacterium]